MKVIAVPFLTLSIAFCAFAWAPPRLAVAAEPSITAEQRDAIMRPVNAWVHAFSTQQAAFPDDAFTDDCLIIDEFAPFAWSPGTTTVRQWYADVEGLDTAADRQSVLRSKESLQVGDPENLTIAGDRAYMSFHATWSATNPKTNKPFVQHGLFTVVERKTKNGWRMIANAWGILED
jgi:ketosteroid isomerase-like protein